MPIVRDHRRANLADVREGRIRRLHRAVIGAYLGGCRPCGPDHDVERVERGLDARIYRQLTGITRAMLPMITRTDVATAESVDVDTLETRLREEAVRLDATMSHLLSSEPGHGTEQEVAGERSRRGAKR